MSRILSFITFLLLSFQVLYAEGPQQWTRYALRDELRPDFSISVAEDAEDHQATVLAISSVGHEAIDGAWIKTVPVQGGRYYRFSALRTTENVISPRRSAMVEITWQNDKGNLVERDNDLARPEYPLDRGKAADGSTLVADTYHAPEGATQAQLALHLRWTKGSVRWRQVKLSEIETPAPRTVRLATVHFRPVNGLTNAEKCQQFSPLIAEAARQKADLVCLPESLTYYHSSRSMAECAEPITGPSTKYFGALARQHNLYIVAGLTELDGTVVYNTAVLLGPDGTMVGKYRKVCLPREEIAAGVTPGDEYPVFDTRFGKLGIMICWDVHFPEVARNLAVGGAEVIAMPIWGGNPTLAKARAIENQIYLVSSTYTDSSRDAMVSGVWDHEGKLLVKSDDQWGRVLVVEVDLTRRTQWDWLGDFKARIHRERPHGGFRD